MNLSRGKFLTNKYVIIACAVIFTIITASFAMIISKADESASIQYRAHVAYNGWMAWQQDGNMSGTVGESRRMEAIKIKLASSVKGSVKYSVFLRDAGWQAEVKDSATAGTEGQSKQMEAIKISLEGDIATKYDVTYRVHVKNKGWLNWVSNGAVAGSETDRLRIEAIEIKLVKKPTTNQTQQPATSVENTRGKVTTLTEEEFAMFCAIIYCESGSEKYEGKLAVANVILNRLYSSKYPNTMEGVIKQKGQFSPVKQGTFAKRVSEYKNGKFTTDNHKQCIQAAREAMAGKNNIGTRNGFMTPSAFKTYGRGAKNVTQIGNHKFFEW